MAISMNNHETRIKKIEDTIWAGNGSGVFITESCTIKTISSNEYRWYRKWSNGMIENYVLKYNASDTNSVAITFEKAFTNTNYIGLKIDSFTTNTGNGWNYLHSKTLSGCKVVANGPTWVSVYCCGF